MYNADPGSYNAFRKTPDEFARAQNHRRVLRNIFLVMLSLIIFLAGGLTTYLLIKNPFSPIATHSSTTPTVTLSPAATASPTPPPPVFQKSLYIRGSVAANPDRLYINLGGNQIGIFSTTNGQLLTRFTLGSAPNLLPIVPVAGVAFILAP